MGHESTSVQGQGKAQTYLTLVAIDMSACKALSRELSIPLKVVCESRLKGGGIPRHSHIHGSNRNRIAQHVMLNDRRNWTRRLFMW